MYINHKKLKFYQWLTKVSPLMFNLEYKVIQRYNFFRMAEKSLNFTASFWTDYVNIFMQLGTILKPGLDKYDQLALEGNMDSMFQWILRIAIFYWKFIPTMLSEFFTYFPMFNVPFGDLEISIFDSWLELPACIDELYNIILENNWSPHLPTVQSQFSLHDILLGDHNLYSQDLWDYVLLTPSDYKNSLDKFIFHQEVPEFLNTEAKNRQKILYEMRELPIFLIAFNVCFNTSINIIHMFKYWLIYKQLYNENWISAGISLNEYILHFFLILLAKNLFFTRQLLFVNDFLDFSARRAYNQECFLSMSFEDQLKSTARKASMNLNRNNSFFSEYSSYEDLIKAYAKKPRASKFPSLPSK